VKRTSFFAVVLAVLALAPAAEAFCRSTTCKCKSTDTCAKDCAVDDKGCKNKGAPLHWSGGCVGFSMNKRFSQNYDPEATRIAVLNSFAAWADVDCGDGKKASIALSALGDVTCHRLDYSPDGPNVNVVFFEDEDFKPGDTSDVLAKTVPHFDPDTGEIFDADIDVDTSENAFGVTDSSKDNDLQSVITHEVGHFLGLDHSSDTTAVMYFEYSAGTLNRELQPDDIAAICAAYPPDRGAKCDPTPKGGQADSCDPTSGGCIAAGASDEPLAMIGAVLTFALISGARRNRRQPRPTAR
jgi:hypothetical protein